MAGSAFRQVPGVFDTNYALIQEQQAANTSGGASTSGSWQTRVLNTIASDLAGIVTSLSSNQFKLQAGTYIIRATAPAANCNRHKLRIRNITDGTTALVGVSEYAGLVGGADTGIEAGVVGKITITSAKTFELQYQVQSAQSSYGLGLASNFGEIEVYGEVEIWQVVGATVNAGNTVVATTVAGLGAGVDGKAGLVRAGSTPYDFMALTYDATYGKWVSGTTTIEPTGQPSGSTTSYADVSAPAGVPLPWRNLDAAGLKPQFRLTAGFSTNGVNAVFGALQAYADDTPGNYNTTQGSQFCVITTATNLGFQDSGWTDLPSPTVKDNLSVRVQWKQASSGSGTLVYAGIHIRWVSK